MKFLAIIFVVIGLSFSRSAFSEEKETKTVIIFTSETCGHCHEVIKFLKDNNIQYTEYSYQTNKQLFRDLGITEVPYTIIRKGKIEERIRGFNEWTFKRVLDIK